MFDCVEPPAPYVMLIKSGCKEVNSIAVFFTDSKASCFLGGKISKETVTFFDDKISLIFIAIILADC